jgi:hypothetical protein
MGSGVLAEDEYDVTSHGKTKLHSSVMILGSYHPTDPLKHDAS